MVNSIYGPMIVNKLDAYQFAPLHNTTIPHINEEIIKLFDILSILPTHPIIIDGGANIGLVTIPIAKNTSGKVYSFEPQKLIYYSLCGNIALNQADNVTAYNLALGETVTTLSTPNINYNAPRDFGDVVLEDTGKNDVSVTTIDSLNLSGLHLLKLDVEKMEYQALLGGIDTIRKFKPWCWIEYIRSDLNELLNFFDDLGYKVYYADEANIVASPNGYTFPWMTEIE